MFREDLECGINISDTPYYDHTKSEIYISEYINGGNFTETDIISNMNIE